MFAIYSLCDFVGSGCVRASLAQVLPFPTAESVLRKVPKSGDFPVEFLLGKAQLTELGAVILSDCAFFFPSHLFRRLKVPFEIVQEFSQERYRCLTWASGCLSVLTPNTTLLLEVRRVEGLSSFFLLHFFFSMSLTGSLALIQSSNSPLNFSAYAVFPCCRGSQ